MLTLYVVFGLILVAAFIVVIFYYYSPKRKDDVEAAKYDMLRDDEQDSAPDDS